MTEQVTIWRGERVRRTSLALESRVSATEPGRVRWQTELSRRVLISDVVVLSIAIALSHVLRFGADEPVGSVQISGVAYTSLGIGLLVGWLALTAVYRTRDHKLLGAGHGEYQRIVKATFVLFGVTSIISVALQWNLSRGYLAIAFPVGLALLLVSRWLWRRWLCHQRAADAMISRVLVIGGTGSARTMTTRFKRNPGLGMRVVGVWVPDREVVGESVIVDGVTFPVLGTETRLEALLERGDIDTVVVTDTEHLGDEGMRQLAWDLDGREIDLLVAPNVVDVAGPRIHVQAHGNMPLIYLSEPTYSASANLPKAIFDRLFAACVLLAASPVLIASAIAIKVTSRGPVTYRSERIGRHGEPFQMIKLRTMVRDADQRREELEQLHDGSGPLFKLQRDPRVTTVGRFLRRFSIDEIPQFVNVLKGDMSIVGPRPPLRVEVEEWDDHVHRRLLVKQGVTGLWQVSGRSDLSWEDSVRLDLDYVENWSMMRDLLIIARTAKAVVAGAGAY